jgi:aspartyl/asparaginyl beta-hydroxylase (cupin superfamily)
VLLFDDSIEHEAWNDSDAPRAILLFEVWRPELTEAERQALTVMFETVAAYTPDQA